jgi:hypothetical protein
MVPEFELVTDAPETDFCQRRCSMSLPPEENLAREIEAERKLETGDVRVEYSRKGGQRHVRVYARVVRMIDCSKKTSWKDDVNACLKTRRGFEILNATKADLSQLDQITRPYADWFQWADSADPTLRRKFRPISQS